jgi:DNA-binding NarL/FixJ family response regulator
MRYLFEVVIVKQQRGRPFHLSPIQHKILDEFERGKRHKETAEKLDISLATLKTHASRILLRTGASNLIEAAWLRRQAMESEAA